MKKRLVALLLCLSMVLVMAACGGTEVKDPETDAPETGTEETVAPETEAEVETVEIKGTIKVGHLLDLTGVEQVVGELASKAFTFASAYVTAQTGWEFEVVEGDCQSDADKAQVSAENMINQGCKVIFGPTQIGHKKSVLGYVADNPCPVVLYNGSPAAFTGGFLFGNDYIVALGGGTAGFPSVMADYLYKEVGLRKVYCFKQDGAGGNNYVDPFKTCFEALGGEVIDNVAVPQPTNDWSAYLAAMINSDAEAIVGWTSSSDTLAFYKEWYNSGAYEKLPVYATMHGGFTDTMVLEQLDGKIVDEVIKHGTCAPICYSYNNDNEYNKAYVEAWEAEFGEVPLGNNLPGSICQALLCLANALDAVGPEASPQELADAMRAAEFDGPEGHTKFEEGSVVAVKDVYVVNVVKLGDSYNYEVAKVYEQIPPIGYNLDKDGNYIG
ncbi:MAG: ABC transporter substrate-binding protein [Lachnospiraceae bacterium]|jgi:ABC-type branched-subunit amino acid transport system substrate-binding protein